MFDSCTKLSYETLRRIASESGAPEYMRGLGGEECPFLDEQNLPLDKNFFCAKITEHSTTQDANSAS